ncbi:class I SAM-dependent methyltransferase [Cellulomonas composti]|uniref:Ubiquinone/menaquinone biosynthesis methyltransferase n=1 Tax=Cellulomonas composti TaxID=266130 RepID=A0A511JDN2_9CELL|nr:class I SAM-dependent methyltransferase [Cellulomonas composti]GEL95899.1 ubiquinone/menaquinone biosynthesis methyltransferase [Cellulomonas composti]
MDDGPHVEYWDRMAGGYDRATAFVERRFLAGSRVWVAERVVGRTLEVAVGTGANLAYYGSRADELVLTDHSAQMIAIARRRATDLGLAAEFHRGDAGGLPFDDEDFDTVVCTLALCCVPDEVAVLRELARVVRADGRVLLVDHVASSSRFWRTVQRGADLVGRRNGERYLRRPLLRLPEAGLVAVEESATRARLVERVVARRA